MFVIIGHEVQKTERPAWARTVYYRNVRCEVVGRAFRMPDNAYENQHGTELFDLAEVDGGQLHRGVDALECKDQPDRLVELPAPGRA